MNKHPYADFLQSVERPGRYIGGEFGSVTPLKSADLRMVLSYPDTYEIGMSHIGLSILYERVNSMERVSCERVFMPWGDLEKELRARDLPLVSLEDARPLCDFDVVGFSLQYELTYTNLIAMLDLGRIPRRAELRRETDPIVIAGGPTAVHCEPISPFIDLVLLGDGEESLTEFLEMLRDLKKKNNSRHEKIEALSNMPFVWNPNNEARIFDYHSERFITKEEKTKASWAKIKKLGTYPSGGTISPNVETVFDRFSLEISRGCIGGCRFCQAGYLYRPVRERTASEVKEAVERAVFCTGFDGVSLASLSTADHSEIGEMLNVLGEEYTPHKVSFFVPSLRAYGLSEEMVEILSRLRATGVTLAPEAGSQRLRDVINKNITEEDLLTASSRFFDWGMTRIKLYFMLGLPSETDEDLLEIIKLSAKVRDFGRKRMHGRTPVVTVSVSTFVPKPFTPFERESMIDEKEIKRRQTLIYEAGRNEKLAVRTHTPALSILEGVLCRGDISLAEALERACDMGARFDGWSDQFREDIWKTVLADSDVSKYLKAIPHDARVSWDNFAVSVSQNFLNKEREQAEKALTTEPCGRIADTDKSSDRFICHNCGAACKRGELPIRPPRIQAQLSTIEPPAPKQKGFPRPRAADEKILYKPVRFILFMAKWGRQSYIGHLDTMRIVMRSLRRAKLQLFYTQGFNPKPKISAGPPLPLGISAMRDPVEVSLVDPPSDEEIMKRLALSCPPDFEFVGIERLEEGQKGLSRRIEKAEYIAKICCERQTAESKLSQIMSSSSLEVLREKQGVQTTVDIRPYIASAKILEQVPSSLLMTIEPNDVLVAFSLYIPGSGGCKPIEFVRAVSPESVSNVKLVRTEICLEKSQ